MFTENGFFFTDFIFFFFCSVSTLYGLKNICYDFQAKNLCKKYILTSVEAWRPRERHPVVRRIHQPEVRRRVGVRKNGQLIHRGRTAESVWRDALVIPVIVLIHLQYRQRRLVKRLVQL